MLRKRTLYKRYMSATVIATIALCSAGMGGLGGGDPTKIPEPAHDFSATVIDQRDVSSDITLISFGGQTFLSGKRGGATVSIPFENIREIAFYMRGNDLFAAVTMKAQPSVEVVVEKDDVFYGQLSYGLFSIKAKDIRKITIHGLTRQEK